MEIIEKALKVASKAHEGQYRKHTETPYITHPVTVGMIVMKAGYDEEMIAAAILHDTVEDTNLSLDDIRQEFGGRIAEIVEGCSEPNKDLPWKARKEHTIEYLKTAPEKIRIVACADKLHNIRTIIKDYEQIGDEVWRRFNAGKEQQKWYYTGIVESLGESSSFPLLSELKLEVDRLFS
jgi:(p)ppGpp synthase/HD superfamily hydrolase